MEFLKHQREALKKYGPLGKAMAIPIEVCAYPEFSKIADHLVQSREEWFINILRTKVSPPIKGPITKGKITWRGLRLCTYENMNWIEQRGKKLYPIFMYQFTYPDGKKHK